MVLLVKRILYCPAVFSHIYLWYIAGFAGGPHRADVAGPVGGTRCEGNGLREPDEIHRGVHRTGTCSGAGGILLTRNPSGSATHEAITYNPS